MRLHGDDLEVKQGVLFPDEDLVLPTSIREMRKSVSAIHAIPTKEEHAQTLNGRRVFDAIILLAQMQCRGREKEMVASLKSDRISPLFEVRVSDIAAIAGTGTNQSRIYSELDKLFEAVFQWNVIGEDDQVEWEMKAHFFSLLGYGKNMKRGLIRFAFDASVLELFLEPTRWAKLSFDIMGGLGTSPAYSLYQNAFKYIGTQQKVTANLPTHIWIELLVGKSRYVLDLPDGSKQINYGDFKRRVLIPAIDRVNNVQALNYTLELKETKSWKRVSKLQFKFIPKVQPSLGLPMTWPPEIIEVLGKIGYSEDDIRDLSQAYSLEEVAEGLNKLQSADTRLKAQGERVGAPRAYLEGILRNLRQGEEADKIEHEKLMAEVRAHEARAAAEDRLAKLKNLFQEHQRNRFADWFNALPAENRDQLVADFISSPDTGPGIRMMLKKGVKESDYGNQALLRTWMSGARPDLLDYALPNPEDKEFEAWMAWRLAGGDVMFFQ